MKIYWVIAIVLGVSFVAMPGRAQAEPVKLPPAPRQGKMSVEEALAKRRTVRHFAARPLSLPQVSQLLWGADGVSDPRGKRTAPSAGATYPLELFLVVGERGVAGLPAGLYRFLPLDHSLELLKTGDPRAEVARASLHQTWMAEAPVMVVFAAVYKRTTQRYGERGVRYTHMEVGSASQNLFLQAESLNLAAGIVGAFEDRALGQALGLGSEPEPLLVMPVGYQY